MDESESLSLEPLEPILARLAPGGRTNLIPTLLEAQAAYGYLPEPVVEALGRGLHIPLAEIHGVIEFYSMLYPRPTGRTIVRVCTSSMCAQAGAEQALHAAARHLGIEPGEVTSDGKFKLERAPCLGLCDHAPAALVGETPVAHLDPAAPQRWLTPPQAPPLGHVGGEPRWLSGRCGVIPPTSPPTRPTGVSPACVAR